MIIHPLPHAFTVCQVQDYSQVDLTQPFCFTGKTDTECSLVCPTVNAPDHPLAREDGWRAFRIEGVLDFSLIGILARIASLLAENGISIFALSTYNTDYILTKADCFERALGLLQEDGYRIQ